MSVKMSEEEEVAGQSKGLYNPRRKLVPVEQVGLVT